VYLCFHAFICSARQPFLQFAKKKSSSIKTDITRDIGWDALMAAGIRPVTQIAIDDT